MAGNNSTITLSILAKNLASGEISKFTANLDALARKGGITGSILQGVGQSFGQMLNPVALVARGIGAVTDVMGDSIKAASDQSEALSKVTVVFGDQADEIAAWARTASTSMGMSETAALSAAGTLGNLFDALDLSSEATESMSKDIVQLAADLGSFNNVSTDDALIALRAGLIGEAEPMRKFGSNLSAARVQAYALAKGMAATAGGITDAIKVQARYALMLEDTVNAQGDFKRTSDGLANSQKTLDAKMADLSVTLGKMLEGPARGFIGFLTGIADAITNPGGASDAAQQMIADIKALHVEAAGGAALTTYAQQVEELREALEHPGNLRGMSDAALAARAWVKALGPEFIVMSGQSVASFQAVAEASRGAGLTFEQFRSRALTLANLHGVFDPLMSGWTGAFATGTGEITTLVRRMSRTLPAAVTHAVMDMESAIKSGKAGIIEQFRDLAWQSKHPFAEVKYENWLRAREKAALRKMKAADAAGMPGIAAQHRQLAADIRAEYSGLPGYMARITADALAALHPIQAMGFTWGDTTPSTWTNSGGGTRRNRVSGKAAGGPVRAGETYTVGEKGPEKLVMGSRSGNIIPNGGGGGIHVHFHSAAVPSEAQGEALARSIGPAIQRYLRQSGSAA